MRMSQSAVKRYPEIKKEVVETTPDMLTGKRLVRCLTFIDIRPVMIYLHTGVGLKTPLCLVESLRNLHGWTISVRQQ